MENKIMYDVIICGGGPAGMTAAIYCARAGVKALVIEKSLMGGRVAVTPVLENYPGFERIDGADLSYKMQKQVEALNVEIVYDEIANLHLRGKVKTVKTVSGDEYNSKCVILAMGSSNKKLGVKNEFSFLGRGLSYCATCDGAFYKGKAVAVAGGGEEAARDALYLSGLASKVYLIDAKGLLETEAKELLPTLESRGIEILSKAAVISLEKDESGRLSGAQVKDLKGGKIQTLPIKGIFAAIGHDSNIHVLAAAGSESPALNEHGFIITDAHMRTDIENVFAAGDITDTVLKQIVTACAQGAVAATSVIKAVRGK